MSGDGDKLARKLEERRMERLEAIEKGDLDAQDRLEQPFLTDHDTQKKYFICNVFDASPKDDIGSMEYPMFSLSKNPDHEIRKYEYNGNRVTIVPSGYGLATIWDKDILIYCLSQLIAAQERGQYIARTLWVRAHDLLTATSRHTDGHSYAQLKAALNRLTGTLITTDLKTNDKHISSGFGLLDSWELVTSPDDESQVIAIEIVLSQWLYNAVLAREVLSIPQEYFELRKALERRLYELARKHCGYQSSWSVSLPKLFAKSGSSGTVKEFRRKIRTIAKLDRLPHYKLVYQPSNDMVRFYARKANGALREMRDILDEPKKTHRRKR